MDHPAWSLPYYNYGPLSVAGCLNIFISAWQWLRTDIEVSESRHTTLDSPSEQIMFGMHTEGSRVCTQIWHRSDLNFTSSRSNLRCLMERVWIRLGMGCLETSPTQTRPHLKRSISLMGPLSRFLPNKSTIWWYRNQPSVYVFNILRSFPHRFFLLPKPEMEIPPCISTSKVKGWK